MALSSVLAGRPVIVDLLQPLSRNGEIKLRSADPLVQPCVNLKYFSNDMDLVALREGLRFVDDVDGLKSHSGRVSSSRFSGAMKKTIIERCRTGYRECSSNPPR